RGKTVAVHGTLNKLMAFLVRLTPRGVILRIGRMIAEKR
ncbi:MAG: hypothetical protein RIR53_635, partial [Bacteroidota bacterium]